MSTDEKAAFTEDDVANDFVDAIDTHVVVQIGSRPVSFPYEWAGDGEDDDVGWPFVVTRDGREFEVDIDVQVTELTPERKARIDAIAPRVGEGS